MAAFPEEESKDVLTIQMYPLST